MAQLVQKPISELLAAFNSVAHSEYDWSENEKALRAACENCPACLLATARQNPSFVVNLDFKAEAKAWVEEYTRYSMGGVGG